MKKCHECQKEYAPQGADNGYCVTCWDKIVRWEEDDREVPSVVPADEDSYDDEWEDASPT